MELEMEHGEEVAAMEEELKGWDTPRREECRIPVATPQCPAPPRKRPVALPELGKERREPPKGGYFQPPDLELLFVLVPPRRQASSCV